MKLAPVIVFVVALAGIAGAVAGLLPAGGQSAAPAPRPAGIADFSPSAEAKPAPAIAFKDGQGADITLEALKGKVLVVNLWATWCGPCIEELPSLAKLAEATKDEGIHVVAISVDRAEPSVVRKFLDKNGAANLEAYQDDGMKLASPLGVRGLPTTFVLDAEGRIRGTLVGPADWTSPAALALIRSFKAG